MNILMISDVYFPRINGVSTSIETFRAALRAHDVEVTLVAPDYAPDFPQAEAHDTLLRIPARRVPFDPEDRLMKRGALARLPQRLHGKPFDLVHVQTPFAAHYAGLRLAGARGIPCLATCHTHFEEYFRHYLPLLPQAMHRLFTRHLVRSQCNALAAVIAPSQAMRQALHGYGVTRPIHVLPTGIPLEKFSSGDRAGFRQRHGIDANTPLALYVGRVAHEKNLHFLLEAFACACRTQPDLRLAIAGEGPALAELKRRVAESAIAGKVLFPGYLDRERELPDCYAAADLFVFASKTETQGLVLLEALAMGLPVLGIPAMGAAEILSPQRGAVCAPDDRAGFGASMGALLRDRHRLAALSAQGKQFAGEWSASGRARQLAMLYHRLGNPATA